MRALKLTLLALFRAMSKGTLPVVLFMLVLALLLFAFLRQTAHAATLCVNPGGTGGCYADIQSAVNAASPGDTINVATGTYPSRFEIHTANLTIIGTSPMNTIIGGFANWGNPTAISGLNIQDNVWAVSNLGTGNLILTNSQIAGMYAGIENEATLTLLNASIGFTGTLSGKGATALGLSNFGSANLTNVTFGNNLDDSIVNSGSLTLVNVTIAPSSRPAPRVARGIGNNWGASITLTNTIIASDQNCSGNTGGFYSGGYNLTTDNSCPFNATGDMTSTNPLLAPLNYYGGTTLVRALMTGSPAIDSGTNIGCPSTDQRGFSRPYGARCDIGAYEYQPPFNVWYFSYFPFISR